MSSTRPEENKILLHIFAQLSPLIFITSPSLFAKRSELPLKGEVKTDVLKQ